jgi:hypothetical protein
METKKTNNLIPHMNLTEVCFALEDLKRISTMVLELNCMSSSPEIETVFQEAVKKADRLVKQFYQIPLPQEE